MSQRKIPTLVFFITLCNFCIGQIVTIQDYSVNNYGQVQLEIEADADSYYLLSAQHQPGSIFESITSMTMGVDGNLIISEPAGAYELQNYKVTKHSITEPDDSDGDGIDDIAEFNSMPSQAPINFAEEIPFLDGTTSLDEYETFSDLAVINDNIPWAPFLNNQEFAKFAILNQNSDEPKVYFINSETHYIHADFIATIETNGASIVTGEIVYNPNEILPNGAFGSYAFNFSFGSSYSFVHTQRTFELLVANMPYLKNNMRHFIGSGGEANYIAQYKDDYIGSRIDVILESEVFSDVDFLPFNQAEGYGYFREMTLSENPGSRDIVLYDALPNSLPRVGGIITSVVQTPLSHVNLRAIQDNVPNAYIKDPLQIDSIANLIGSYIYYRVEADKYYIREATLEEVNIWYENIRPTDPQIPERDLSFTKILPLDSVEFDMSTAFGAKCTNVATMRKFGFPEGTIPDGFGIPFYFYDEFMKYNNFYEEVELMITDPDFITDLEIRIERLKDFRKDIKDAPMPQWMLDALQDMHDAFPEGTAVRCRSSTNNEDLPGFSGAGLYTSKTQHLDEGHISKSIKQVYASMWNFRAYDERDFYRVDQYIAAMGILCHPNYDEEKSNGVGVSIDPIYETANTFYLNTQVGEFLITNPDANSIPEEILLSIDPEEGYFILRESNLVVPGELVMEEHFLDSLRNYLKLIHDEFAILYNVVGAEGFGMDIEYKVTAEDQLIIKQARPWVSFWAEIKATHDLAMEEIINPQTSADMGTNELVTVKIANKGLKDLNEFDISLFIDDQFIETISILETLGAQNEAAYEFTVSHDFSQIADYHILTVVSHISDGYSANDTLNTIVSQLHLLEGGISIGETIAKCGSEIELKANVINFGAETFNLTEIEVIANGLAVDTFVYDFGIPYLVEVELSIIVTENLQPSDNEIVLNLIRVNGQEDAINTNNSATTSTNLDSNFDVVTLIINPDDFPNESSWQIYDELNNEIVASGDLITGSAAFNEEICVDYGSCLTLNVFDSFGDGICCAYGEGNFFVVSTTGDTLIANDGDFGFEANELFCPNGEGCAFTADITSTNATDEFSDDGILTIIPVEGVAPFQYSISGGQIFEDSNIFSDLAPGIYDIVITDSWGLCIYEESVEVKFDVIIGADDIAISDIKVYPNPTNGIFVIQIDPAFDIPGDVEIEIYDCIGRLIHANSILRFDGESKAEISLREYDSGSYTARCYNENFEKYIKVIKI